MVELLLHVCGEDAEAISERLLDELGALSVTVEDGDAGAPDEQPLFGEPGLPSQDAGWRRTSLRALFVDESAATSAATLLLSSAAMARLRVASLRPVADADWVKLTQAQFTPVEVTPDFWIVPTWHARPAAAVRVVRLDPGLAFGTGSHPTTRMCLRWIARAGAPIAAGWSRVLDYGCGSGILAIAAALCGARHVDAVDIDPAAVASARVNARANGVEIEVGLPDAATGSYGLVVANILAQPLRLLAPVLCGHVSRGGYLVLAGILERQVAELVDAYADWIRLKPVDSEDGWVLLAGRRAA